MALLAAASCTKDPATKPSPSPAAPTSSEYQPEAKQALTYTTPAGWVSEKPTEPMRKAQYRVPGKGGGGPALLTFFRMSNMPVDTMVQYWRDKMGGADAAVTKVEGAKCPTTIVDISGASSDANIDNARFLGAIIDVGNDQWAWYLKFVGPAETVTAWKADFLAMLKGVRTVE